MKVACFFMVCLVAGAQANIFSDFGNSLKTVFSTLGNAVMEELNTTGVKLLNSGVEAGKTLLSQGVQALALNTANALENANKGTRDTDLMAKVEGSLQKLIDQLGGELHNNHQFFVHAMKAVVDNAAHMQFEPKTLNAVVDTLVGKHNSIADGFLTALKNGADNIVASLIPSHKRNAFTEFFHGIGLTLANQFQPMVDGAKTLATMAGSAIKSGAANLLEGAKQSVAQLGQKLSPHLEALGSSLGQIAMSGAGAVDALKQATGDILTQTATNMQKPLTDMMNTVTDAGKTAVQHVAGSILGTNTDPAQQ